MGGCITKEETVTNKQQNNKSSSDPVFVDVLPVPSSSSSSSSISAASVSASLSLSLSYTNHHKSTKGQVADSAEIQTDGPNLTWPSVAPITIPEQDEEQEEREGGEGVNTNRESITSPVPFTPLQTTPISPHLTHILVSTPARKKVELASSDEIESEDLPMSPTTKEDEVSSDDSSDDDDNNGDDNDDDDDDDDDDSDDDVAELSPDRALEIAQQTAALIVVHQIPPRKVRGILSTSNLLNGCTRSLSPMVQAQRKKGVRFNMNDHLWTERASLSLVLTSPTASNTNFSPQRSTAVSTPTNRGSANSQQLNKKDKPLRKVAASETGEGRALHKPSISTPSGVHSESEPSPTLSSSHHPNSNSTAASTSSPSAVIQPRQYTSSARIAGSSSFRARLAAGPDRSEAVTNLTSSISSSTNFLLKLQSSQIIHLNYTSLQQLFLLYSKAARNVRDKTGAWAHHTGGSGSKDSHHHHQHGQSKRRSHSRNMSHDPYNGPVLRKDSGIASSSASFLAAVGLDLSAAGSFHANNGVAHTPTNGTGSNRNSLTTTPMTPSGSGVAWIDLDSSCSMSLDEMHVLALHLVQKKLEVCMHELSTSTAVTSGRTRLTNLLKTTRFVLFPPMPKTGSIAPTTTTTTTSASDLSPHHDGTAAVTDESAITEQFVQSTMKVMQGKLGTNNFSELTWGGLMDNWTKFASFYFLYRSDTNPEGVQTPIISHANRTSGRKSIQPGCNIM